MIYSNVAPMLNQPYRVLPVAHDWSSPFTDSYEFMTDLMRSANGKEQRGAVRYYPRRTFELSLNYMNGQKYALDRFFDQHPSKLAWIPEEPKVTFATGVLDEEALSVSVRNADKSWMVPGTDVLLQWKGMAETRTLSSAGSGVLSFTEKNKTVFPVGTKITAAQLCRIDMNPESTRMSSAAGTMRIKATVDPNYKPYAAGVAGRQYLDLREYFTSRQNWSDNPTVTHEWPIDLIDYGHGRIATFVSEQFPQRVYKANFWKATADETRQLIDFFCRHWGMNREFFVSSWEPEIPYFAAAGNTKSIFVEGLAFADAYRDSTVYKRVMIKLKDGTEIHRQVDFIEALPETNFSVIWLTEDLPNVPIAPKDTVGIFWVTVARFATDRLDVSWVTNEVGKLALPFRNLENPDV